MVDRIPTLDEAIAAADDAVMQQSINGFVSRPSIERKALAVLTIAAEQMRDLGKPVAGSMGPGAPELTKGEKAIIGNQRLIMLALAVRFSEAGGNGATIYAEKLLKRTLDMERGWGWVDEI